MNPLMANHEPKVVVCVNCGASEPMQARTNTTYCGFYGYPYARVPHQFVPLAEIRKAVEERHAQCPAADKS